MLACLACTSAVISTLALSRSLRKLGLCGCNISASFQWMAASFHLPSLPSMLPRWITPSIQPGRSLTTSCASMHASSYFSSLTSAFARVCVR